MTAYFIWYVSEGKGLYFRNEVRLFNSLVEEMRTRTGQDYDRAVIYMGESISTIAHTALGHDDGGPRRKNRDGLSMMSFADAYDDLKLPVHFVPVGDAGAYQLKIMHIPGYREALARAIMGDAYTEPHSGLPDTDTMLDDMPAVIAVDMDIKRIDRATVQAGEAGYDTIAIYALPWQTDFLLERYPGASVYALDIGELNTAMGNSLTLYEPGEDALVSEEGRKNATTILLNPKPYSPQPFKTGCTCTKVLPPKSPPPLVAIWISVPPISFLFLERWRSMRLRKMSFRRTTTAVKRMAHAAIRRKVPSRPKQYAITICCSRISFPTHFKSTSSPLTPRSPPKGRRSTLRRCAFLTSRKWSSSCERFSVRPSAWRFCSICSPASVWASSSL